MSARGRGGGGGGRAAAHHLFPLQVPLHPAAAPLHPPPLGRREAKLVSLVVSVFTATYVRRWDEHLVGVPLRSTPAFDGRAVCYPADRTLRDYLCWRQADTHINNLVGAPAAHCLLLRPPPLIPPP